MFRDSVPPSGFEPVNGRKLRPFLRFSQHETEPSSGETHGNTNVRFHPGDRPRIPDRHGKRSPLITFLKQASCGSPATLKAPSSTEASNVATGGGGNTRHFPVFPLTSCGDGLEALPVLFHGEKARRSTEPRRRRPLPAAAFCFGLRKSDVIV